MSTPDTSPRPRPRRRALAAPLVVLAGLIAILAAWAAPTAWHRPVAHALGYALAALLGILILGLGISAVAMGWRDTRR